jgi:D-alanyl-lipoteichoic acid acyltransferase DltB (MBOAT superfamily)
VEQLFEAAKGFLNYSAEKPWFFTEFSFLLVLPFLLAGYALINGTKKLKLGYLILFSLFFYYKSSGPFLLLFMAVIILDYFLASFLARLEGLKKKIVLFLSVLYSISFLLYFKYSNFIIANLNQFFDTGFTEQSLFLPIGISFYTFQSLSYLIDVARKEIKPSGNILEYAFYMTFFPHLVAGPIVRARDFLPQIYQPLTIDRNLSAEAFFKICSGLVKKLLLADFLAKYVDIVHDFPDGFSGLENLISMYAYSFQIYFDFSGYSDIAIGIALLLGYRLKENFNNPYLAGNITDFWRRWHISLSLWLRDYIYIPLGGNRKGVFSMYLFLMITMLVGGFWHGADWKFVLWGLAHGLLLVLHKLLSPWLKINPGWVKPLWILITFHLVAALWIFFRAQSLDFALISIQSIIQRTNVFDVPSFWEARPEILLLLAVSACIVFFPERIKQNLISGFLAIPLFTWSIIFLLILQMIIQFRDHTVQPFIYFQF